MARPSPAVISLHVAAMVDDNVVPNRRLSSRPSMRRTASPSSRGGVSLDARGKKLVRAQVKAEIKANLTDEMLVAAYQLHNSFDKAADALSEQPRRRTSLGTRSGGLSNERRKLALSNPRMTPPPSAGLSRRKPRDRGKKIDRGTASDASGFRCRTRDAFAVDQRFPATPGPASEAGRLITGQSRAYLCIPRGVLPRRSPSRAVP